MYIHFVSYVLYLKLTSLFSLKDSYFGFLPRSDKFVFKHIGKVLHCISSLKQWRFIEWVFFQSSFVRTFKFTNLFSLNDSDFCRDLTNFSSNISAMYFLIKGCFFSVKNGKVTYFVVSQNLWNFNTHLFYFLLLLFCSVRLSLLSELIKTLAGWFSYWGKSPAVSREGWPVKNSAVESDLSKKQNKTKKVKKANFKIFQNFLKRKIVTRRSQ